MIRTNLAANYWEIDFPNKIFGEIEMKDKYLSWLANVLVQAMQRTIWQNRKIYGEKGVQNELWKYFKCKLRNFKHFESCKHFFWGTAFLEEIPEVHLCILSVTR